jgi:hypothetical protein
MTAHDTHETVPRWRTKTLRRLTARLHWIAIFMWGIAFLMALLPLLKP